jgi:hypothetical protein
MTRLVPSCAPAAAPHHARLEMDLLARLCAAHPAGVAAEAVLLGHEPTCALPALACHVDRCVLSIAAVATV